MKRSLAISFSLIIVVLLGAFLMVQPRVQAAPQAVVVSITVSPSSIPADTTEGNCATGTPYAIYVTATGLDNTQTYAVKAYHYRTADTANRGCFWNWQTASWVVIDNTYNNLPTFSGATAWSGWLYLKDVTGHAGTSDLKLRVRLRLGATTADDDTTSPTAFDTTTAGGWVTGHAYTAGGTLFSHAPVIIRNGANAIIGTYVTEDNAVAEGYTTADTGYYKVAAPVGTGYTAEVWGSNNAITGTATTGLNVTANATTANVLINVPDTTAPTVLSTIPVSNTTGASLYQPVSAVFNEGLNPATVNAATFTLINASGSVAGAVSYSARTATFTPDSSLAASTRYTATLTTGLQDVAGNPLAAPYAWSFTTGAADNTPPTIVSHFPATEAISVPLNSRIIITFSESLKTSTVISSNFTLVGPSGSIGWSSITYDANTDRVTLTPIALSLQARHTVTLSSGITDWAGNPVAVSSWSFTTSADTPMRAYFGDLHNHTSYSDGSLTAATAYATGRANGFDFMAVTDHSYAVDDGEWADMLTAANNATIDGVFVALRGVEYTQGAEGHINVINTVRHPVRTNTGCSYCDYTPNLEAGVTVDGFYHWLSITGTVGLNGEATIAQFNHPGWINFNDWAYHPEVSPTMKVEEVGNGSGTSYVFSEDEYIRSLDYGWKLGATNNADTHSPYWGSNTPHRTGVWLANLTKPDLLAALQARRTFATEDKNYALSMKANGQWMGSDIPNSGSLNFLVTGADPDNNEGSVTVKLITFGGAVVTQTQFASSTFTWQPIVPVTPGEHYYYVKVTQADGDRIVSSPIWAHGEVDVSLTDLVVEPTIASIYNPSLITARVTNRMATTQTVTVTFQIPGEPLQSLATTMPGCVKGPCVDGYASISWQPTVTGPITISAMLSGTPAGDNLEDNLRSTVMHVTDEHLPLVLIDAAHNNINAGGREMRMFVKDLSDHRYNVLKQLTPFTAAALNTQTVKLLVITAFEIPYSPAELNAIADYAATGGSLWICNVADYNVKLPWANTAADRLNTLITAIEARTGAPINMRMNDDEVIDGNSNNGYVFGVEPRNFPGEAATGIGINVERISTWSLGSIRGPLVTLPITAGTPGVQIVVQGDMDAGYSNDFYHNPYHTNNTDSDNGADAYIYNPTWVYPTAQPAGAIPLPMAAVTQLPGAGGRIMLYGDSNDGFGTFAYTAGDGKQNELFNLETVMWLLGDPVQKSSIAQARAYDVVNEPNNYRKLVWVEGKITAAYGEFFNVLYVQDGTGGITIHAPAGDISATQYARGAYVRALGTIDVYQGDTEVEFFEAEQVQVITPTNGIDPAPLPLSTHDAALESNQGWLTQITGTVTLKDGESIFVDDGSGPVRAFLDGYNGVWDNLHALDQVTIKGLISEDGAGPRIRVRNYGMHYPAIPNDVTILTPGLSFSGSTASVAPSAVKGGDLLTYTFTISNSGTATGPFVLTDTLDSHVSLVSAPDMTAAGSTLLANGTINGQTTRTFAVTVRANYGYSGTISNTAQLSGDGFTTSLNAFAVQVNGAYGVYLPLLRK